jgi:hypothetical protein
MDSVNNNIETNGIFYKIKYINNSITLNNTYISFNIKIQEIVYYESKKIFIFKLEDTINQIHINNLISVETYILNKINIENKIPQYNIKNRLKKNNIRITSTFNKDKIITGNNVKCNTIINQCFSLKISGIWENDQHYGLTYKFELIS